MHGLGAAMQPFRIITDYTDYTIGWLGGTTGSASDQRSEGCGFEAY